ncbi:Gfo/Idh/MocA family protein [Trichlorobacter ammonificans]|uniref:UDP-N-acetyl-2-amino-2-deoxy-D-glucuronate oxidase n=1 Tax=Trichlorobacter ammonificans TaxID=2916410 RepID=A0ABN8HMS8_9BACT|nr:Gfo/Idh/MocA family oxidoreductase [Trichlorobacter ammonificans]CAH2032352.1 UDP-N-acetyl-2-amino-2-deoxy-D-glucuronate oxidase [Trichlorobacter ammonificans]
MKNFAIIGVGGYIAPRHLKAIKDTGNRLVAALDVNDSVGILDRFFSDVPFFTEFERFDRFAEKLRRQVGESRIEYVSICSPNYLHDAHIRFALRIGADAICEKPLVLNPWNLDALQELEEESGRRVNTILQLRVHPSLVALRESLLGDYPAGGQVKHDVTLTYITSRGPWYLNSWKGNPEKAGGVATNIGIHFFDLLIWLFGAVQGSDVHYADSLKTGGYIELERARVKWFLSIDRKDLPESATECGLSTFRSITVDGKEIEFSEGFTDLHTVVYQRTLEGNGFGLNDARPAIVLAHDIREARQIGISASSHPFLQHIHEVNHG